MSFKNWVFFPEHIEVPIHTTNLYEWFKMEPPSKSLIDNKVYTKFKPYVLEGTVNYEEIRQKNIVLYLSLSPKLGGYNVETALFVAALNIAAEESTGTWDPDLHTLKEDEMDEKTKQNMKILEAKVIGLNFKTGMAAIAYPVEGFEPGNLPMLLSVIEGNYTGMTSAVYGVRLEDVDFPDSYANSFMGPTIGDDGIRKIYGDKIMVGTIIKPKTGLSAYDWAKAAKRSLLGGLEIVKDDENLTNQEYCPFDERVKLVLKDIKEIEQKTGRKLMYVCNVTCGDIDEMIRRANLIKENGGNCLMIDILAAGFAAVQTLRKKFPDMILHGHRAGHGAKTIFPSFEFEGKKFSLRHGISMKVVAMVARLAGIDQLHVGAPKGKMEASHEHVLQNLEGCSRPMGKIKACRPICSGGLRSPVMWDVARIMNLGKPGYNQNFIFQAGGGTHAHPLGTFAGAKSLAQARDAIAEGKDYKQCISENFEELLAFRRWEKEMYAEWVKSLKSDSKIVVEPDTRIYGTNEGIKPSPLPLKEAIQKFPELKEDIEKYNPGIL
jgi:ribulose-bisphosphate carboxylase large chain